jgi:hypothetical protein
MLPQTQQRKPRNSARMNLLISLFFHGAILGALLYFAAREGLLGKQLRKIAVEIVKEKPPDKPKEPEKRKEEPPKVDVPKIVEVPKVEPPKEMAQTPPPNTGAAPPAMAPPSQDVGSFVFDGGKAVETSSDPVQLYKGLLEYSLRSRWDRPEDMDDHDFVVEVEVSVDRKGQIANPVWKKGSGETRWDNSVRQAIAKTSGVSRPPPSNFPSRVVVRFDVVPAEPVNP